jgi:hypothetical protein
MAGVGAMAYTIIVNAIIERLATNARVSVATVAGGISVRSNFMFRMIDSRMVIAFVELATAAITSWNGMIAHARLRPGAWPGLSSANVTSRRYTPSRAYGSSNHLTSRSRPRPYRALRSARARAIRMSSIRESRDLLKSPTAAGRPDLAALWSTSAISSG